MSCQPQGCRETLPFQTRWLTAQPTRVSAGPIHTTHACTVSDPRPHQSNGARRYIVFARDSVPSSPLCSGRADRCAAVVGSLSHCSTALSDHQSRCPRWSANPTAFASLARASGPVTTHPTHPPHPNVPATPPPSVRAGHSESGLRWPNHCCPQVSAGSFTTMGYTPIALRRESSSHSSRRNPTAPRLRPLLESLGVRQVGAALLAVCSLSLWLQRVVSCSAELSNPLGRVWVRSGQEGAH